ncbi:hypothetical protein FOXB_17713, partial [Fusarium oxysporum f. sp. conglutinans Fo5176]
PDLPAVPIRSNRSYSARRVPRSPTYLSPARDNSGKKSQGLSVSGLINRLHQHLSAYTRPTTRPLTFPWGRRQHLGIIYIKGLRTGQTSEPDTPLFTLKLIYKYYIYLHFLKYYRVLKVIGAKYFNLDSSLINGPRCYFDKLVNKLP